MNQKQIENLFIIIEMNRYPYKGNWRNTAGWTTVWVTGQIIDKIGPILATKY